ncbi:MAG: glucosaminidase domain-containing protein [Selenomonas sp.]|nr:glucosaminidase domain-containing protein [Selenomonas sp.]
MIGQIIRSYLVSLGVQIDEPGFQQADATIQRTGENIDRVTAGMARNFVKASTIISSAIASVTASAVGLMKATAQEDLAMQKYARSMMMSEEAAWNMKKATDALGESINDIALTPELMSRFNQLSQDGSKMMVGGDFKETMKNFRDLMFEFTRLKQEASYALNWIGYYLMKYLQKPLADIREKFKTFNDMVIKNMSVWTEKVARAIYYVIEVGRHLLEFIVNIGKHVKALWDSFPSGVKKAIAAVTALQVALSAGPLGRAIMLISTLLLLIDDYYGYMEGKDALLGKYWDKLNNFLDTAKQKYEELKAIVEPYWDKLVGYVQQAKQWFDELVDSINEWGDSTGSEMLQDFLDECKDWWQILTDLYNVIENNVKKAWKILMEEMEKNDTINDVRHLLERLWRIFVILYEAVKDVIEGIIQLADEIAKTEEWQEFIAVVGELFDGIVELFDAIMELVEVALTALFGQFEKTDIVFSFRDVLRAVLKVFTGIIRAVNWVIGLLKDLFNLVAGNKTFKKFWEEVGNAIGDAISKIGTFGNKLRELWDWITGKSSSKGGKDSKGYDKNANALAQEAYEEAKRIAPDLDMDADLLYGQWYHETKGFKSRLSKENYNFGGLTQTTPNGEENKQPDGGNYYMEFSSPKEYADYYKRVWGPYIKGAKSAAELGRRLKSEGYYTADEGEYVAGIQNGMKNLPQEPIGQVGYTGDFDTSKWNIWSSTEGANTTWDSTVTDIRGWQQEVVDFMNDAGDALSRIGVKGTITGAAEKNTSTKKYHNKGRYSHENGYKVDISDGNIPYGSEAYEILKTLAESHGGRLDYEADKGHYDITIYPQGVLGFADAQTAAALGGQPVNNTELNLPLEGFDLSKLDEVREVLNQIKGMLPTDYFESLSETLDELTLPEKAKETIGGIVGKGQEVANNIKDVITSATLGFMGSKSADNNYGIQRPDTQTGNRAETQAPEETDGISMYLKQIVSVLQSIDKGILQGTNIELPELQLPEVKPEGNSKKEAGENLGNYFNQILDMLLSIRKAMPGTPDIELPELKLPEVKPEGNSKKEAGENIGSYFNQVLDILLSIRKAMPGTPNIELPELKLPEVKPEGNSKKEAGENLGDYFNQILDRLSMIQKAMPSIPEIEFPKLEIPAVSLEGNPLGVLLEEFSKIGEKFADSKMFEGIDVAGMMEKGMQAIQPMAQNEYRDYTGNTTVTNNNSPSITMNVDVTVNGAGKTNSTIGKEVGSEIMQAASRFFADNCLLNGSRPTKTAIEQYSN